MLTHELADALLKLAKALRDSPNIDIDDLSRLRNVLVHSPNKRRRSTSSDDLPIALSALLSLSSIDKQEWINLITDMGFSIEVRPRDASRDILGKVLRVLEADPEARARLNKRVQSKEAQASPELARALSSLLK